MRRIPACREIIRLTALGCSDKKISEITGSTRRTVKKIREQAVLRELAWPLDYKMNDEKVYYTLFPPKTNERKNKKPNLEQVYSKLMINPIKSEQYKEYANECLENNEFPVSYRRFVELIKEEEKNHRVTEERIKPGELLVMFWTDYTVKLQDRKTEKAYVLMGILPYSQNLFVKAYKDRGVKTWIKANQEMFQYFDGVPKEVVVRGMKSGLSRCMSDMMYVQLIEHYGVIRTRDGKKKCESEILEMQNWFRNKLYDKTFATLAHLNEALEGHRKDFLNIQVCGEKTRDMIFRLDEKPYLRKLPEDVYYACVRKTAKIQRNSHISYEKRYYSVPYQFLAEDKTTVEIEVNSWKIVIYYADEVIAEHPNLRREYEGMYSTRLEHMPSDEQEMLLEWNREYFIKRADRAGKNTRRVIEAVMNSKYIRQQTYKACDAILRLGTEYTYAKLEAVCANIAYVRNGSVYKTIVDELKTMTQ